MTSSSGRPGDESRSDPDPRGLLFESAERVTLHLACRLPNRLFMMANPIGPLRHRLGRQVGIALIGSDLAQAWLLRRGMLDGRRGRPARMVMDAINAAAVVGLSPFDAACGCGALLDSAPLTAETAYRDGALRAFAATLPTAAAVAGPRVAKGRSPGLGDIAFWTAMQVAFGKLVSIAERSQVRRRSEREAVRRQAAGEQGYLDGRRAWVRAHVKLLDRLQRFGLRIVEIPGVHLANARELDKLAKTARQVEPPAPGRPAFLAALLQQYQLDRKLSHVIADRIDLTELPPADAQLLLTPHQTRRLWDALTLHGVAGELTVAITERINRGLDTDLTLHITSSRTLGGGPPTDTHLKLPTGSPAWRVEFVTIGLLWGAVYQLIACMPQPAGAGVSWRVGGVCATASAVAATLVERRVRRRGSDAAPGAALTGLGPALLMASWGSRRLRVTHNPAGISMFPGIWALNGIGFVLAFYTSRMSWRNKAQLAAGVGLHLALTWICGHPPRSRSIFLLDLLNWTATTAFAGARLAAALGKLSAHVVQQNERETAVHASEQRLTGWGHQHHEAELLQDLARRTLDQAQPNTPRHQDKIHTARREHTRLTEDLRRARTPWLGDGTEW